MAIVNTFDDAAALHWMKGMGWRVEYLMAQHFADAAARLVPVDTGALRASIHLEVGGVEAAPGQVASTFGGDDIPTAHVVAGNDQVNYAQPVEFGFFLHGGGRWMPPQPFMRNAMSETIGAFNEIVAAAISSTPT